MEIAYAKKEKKRQKRQKYMIIFFFSSSLKELNIIMVKFQQEQYIKQLVLNIDF